ncbi:RNA polymerase sigma factor [Pedobacter lusitanus]|uniref:RNA polymerase sigma factor n=1 Tax=Pedobacter lusitanus TaxID=1503925 RepID=UPI0006965446|nr:sigma-70 family RNA polymerase sigma factor [Pedobacter lusitanus]
MKEFSDSDDNDILLSFLAGDKRAYEVIYDRFWPILYRHARKMLQNEEDAKDVVQEVFTMLWTRVNENTIKPPLAAFLYTCTRNKILDLIKHTKVKARYTSSLKNMMNNMPQLPDAIFIERELAGQIEEEVLPLSNLFQSWILKMARMTDKIPTMFILRYKSTSMPHGSLHRVPKGELVLMELITSTTRLLMVCITFIHAMPLK